MYLVVSFLFELYSVKPNTKKKMNSHHDPEGRSKTQGLLQIEAQSEHLQAPQKRAAKSSWTSKNLGEHVNSIPFRGCVEICWDAFRCLQFNRFKPYHCTVLHHLHFIEDSSNLSSSKKIPKTKSRECQPLPGTRACPTTDPAEFLEVEYLPTGYPDLWLYQMLHHNTIVGLGQPVPEARHRCYFSLRCSLTRYNRLLLRNGLLKVVEVQPVFNSVFPHTWYRLMKTIAVTNLIMLDICLDILINPIPLWLTTSGLTMVF